MKTPKHISLLLITVLAFFQVSCINDNLSDSYSDGQSVLKPLSAQVEAMKISADEITSILSDIEDENGLLADAAAMIDEHMANVESGASLQTATLSAMEIQKSLASAVAAVSGEVSEEKLSSLEKGVSSWIGDEFTYCYPLASIIFFILGMLLLAEIMKDIIVSHKSCFRILIPSPNSILSFKYSSI
mgnify:CR=1 FL=1